MVQQFSAILEKILRVVVNNGHTSRNHRLHDRSKYIVAEEPEDDDSLLEEEGDKFSNILKRVLTHFEKHKPYLDPNLKIADVAREVATNRNYLSKAINLGLSRNFNQLCNYYRIRYACNLYLKETTVKVMEMCEKSGFNSNSAFLSAFNNCVGLSPAKWCRNVNYRLLRRENVKVEDYIKPLIIKNNLS